MSELYSPHPLSPEQTKKLADQARDLKPLGEHQTVSEVWDKIQDLRKEQDVQTQTDKNQSEMPASNPKNSSEKVISQFEPITLPHDKEGVLERKLTEYESRLQKYRDSLTQDARTNFANTQIETVEFFLDTFYKYAVLDKLLNVRSIDVAGELFDEIEQDLEVFLKRFTPEQQAFLRDTLSMPVKHAAFKNAWNVTRNNTLGKANHGGSGLQ
jgi:hypothetical protein